MVKSPNYRVLTIDYSEPITMAISCLIFCLVNNTFDTFYFYVSQGLVDTFANLILDCEHRFSVGIFMPVSS